MASLPDEGPNAVPGREEEEELSEGLGKKPG